MDISAIHRSLEASAVPPEELAGNRQLNEEQKLGEAARQFEALLLRQILENTQKTVIPSSFTDDSTAASIYQSLVSQQLADSISKSGTLGLATLLQHQLTRQAHPASLAGHDLKPEAQPTSPSGGGVARPLTCAEIRPPPLLTLHPPAPPLLTLQPPTKGADLISHE